MVQTLAKTTFVTFAEFAQWLPENRRYELHDGVIIEMPQHIGKHEQVKGFLAVEIAFMVRHLNLPYFLPSQAFVKVPDAESAYLPDILILKRSNLANEPLWEKQSTVTQGDSVVIAIEVVSTNWRVDYFTKVKDYEEIGIPEYWTVDYLGIGGRRFIGNPKQPTILVHELIDGEYQVTAFQGDERVISPSFPDLNLTAIQIFQAGL
ncbi:MAG: Uma2 family endonuclease [Pseudanabaena sp. M135S2SP2A07QC]|nr:Uma2 family endonuclease [Pseudanabaena sp. M090S1SP2A07QC]MCA6507690.1 Uma2 family endonuclease [Pseudanabaena sp. M172S2SP2A07QC]MCA6522043.1 Uma2 family endonuclease [Pseudanabaena sp. M051S1SP2A07QC]MCA6527954.1 Uma2 family endonuclease [Pseudanabaena sp. M179S2SP2A07QC]MCA6530050.1 Uma2 family endonuclease [Pseudanabaena sp. M125S2SP2A07QC]MCA6533069.1 Uma2 family endonuclease [Pseudanabaena sp. M176S2SP2A07QC]MCA6538656.1 Uma2 family endonuclease [Pseudanabaena sp. M037S2SP2A07QC]MC